METVKHRRLSDGTGIINTPGFLQTRQHFPRQGESADNPEKPGVIQYARKHYYYPG